MTEYISREEVMSIITNMKTEYLKDFANLEDRYVVAHLFEVADKIKDLKTADVQPVIHAYWINLPKALNPNENPCKCSNCGHILSFMNYYPKSNYCPKCGARMDLK